MSVNSREDPEQAKDRFVRETISGNRKRAGRVAGRVLLVFCLAVVFGLTSSLAFVVSRPYWEDRFAKPTTSHGGTIIIFPDEPTPEETTAPAEGDVETTADTTEPDDVRTTEDDGLKSLAESLWEYMKPDVEKAVDDRELDIFDQDALFRAKRNVVSTAMRSVVTITEMSNATDWFENQVSSSQEGFGVVIAVTDSEVLILTSADMVSSGTIYVSTDSVREVAAGVKGVDSIYNIAVVSLPVESIGAEIASRFVPIRMGNSYGVLAGQEVMAIGRPMGRRNSVQFGTVSYIDTTVQSVDAQVRLFQTDMIDVEDSQGILINTSGEMIGMLTKQYDKYGVAGLQSAVSIADLRSIIENLSNGRQTCLLGIRGEAVTPLIAEQYKLPMGIYVDRCISAGAAEAAGIQQGDIITEIDDAEISSFTELSLALAGHKPGDIISIVVQRRVRGGFNTIIFDVVLGTR